MIDQELESRRIRANEARQFMENPLFREAFDGVADYLHQAALSCDVDNKDKTQRIVISQQLLEAVQREIIRKVEDGDMATIQINELDQRRGLRKFLR